MTATISRLPVQRKRDRKVTKGSKASVTVIYELAEAAQATREADRMEEMAQLIAKRAIRKRQEAAEYEAWIDASATVARFPEGRRARTLVGVARLKRGETEFPDDDDEDCEDGSLSARMREFASRTARRSREILGESPDSDFKR